MKRRVLSSLLLACLFAVSAFARQLPNIDRFGEKPATPATAAALAHKAEVFSKKGLPMQGEPRLGVPTFVWGTAGATRSEASLKPVINATPMQAEAAARGYLARAASLYELDDVDVSDASVRYVHDSGKGPIIVKLQQKIDGIEIFREELNVVMNQKLELVAMSGYISSKATKPATGTLAFRLTDRAAAANAVRDLTTAPVNLSDLVPAGSHDGYDYFSLPSSSGAVLVEPVRMKKVLFHMPDGLEPAYYIEVIAQNTSVDPSEVRIDTHENLVDGYSYVISAVDGGILFRMNLSSDAQSGSGEASLAPGGFSYKVWADPVTGIPYDTPAGNGVHPKIATTPDGVQYPFTGAQTVTLPNYPFSNNDPWLAPGSTQTTGNNVEAFVNLVNAAGNVDNGFGPAQEPPVDPPLGDHHAFTSAVDSFLYTHQPDVDAFSATARQGSITQLFYNINFLHDWYYDSGFNEVSGNAQTNNFGRGGIGNDNIKGQAQDTSSFSNANMLTPADGGRPRMRMYNFPNLANMLDIQSPALGKANIGISQTGLRNFDVTAPIVIATFGAAPTCTITNAAALANNIAMFDFDNTDGTGCSFSTRITRIHATSALAALMVYTSANASAVANITGINSTHTKGIGVISWSNGQVLKTNLASGTVTARLLRVADRDGSLDQQIVFHEWGHYLSNRLIGNASGLNANYAGGMGEGWGDFSAMMLTVRADDTSTPTNANWNGAYGLATYATSGVPFNGSANQGYYYGIRRYPYSTDLTINPLTFRHIANGIPLPVTPPPAFGATGTNNAEVHNTGEVWTAMLWECYAALLRDTLGTTPRLTFQQAQDRMKLYLVASLKLTPLTPTMLETRDAVLAAAYATDYTDFIEFAQAFAKRGAGLYAVSPDRFSGTNSPVTESYVVGGELTFVSASLDDSNGSCDNDGTFDANEGGKLTITLRNIGDQFLTGTTATVTTTNPNVTFLNGGNITFAPSEPYGTTTGSVGVALSGSAGIETIDLTISYNDPDLLVAGPRTVTAYVAANYNTIPASTATDDVEGPNHWVVQGNAAAGLFPYGPFVRKQATTSTNHFWFAPDNYFGSDQYLVSPVFTVNGGGSLNLQFDHSYGFEFDGGGNYDGGVVEMSVNGGAFGDISPAAYNGTILNYSGDVNPLKGRLGFVQNSGGTIHTSLTAAIAPGSTVQVRFRAGSDSSVGSTGWTIDNIAFSGVVETPFDTIVADPGCTAATSTTLSSSANPSPLGASLTLTANVVSLRGTPAGTVTFFDGASSIGSAALSGGVASMSTSSLTLGSHSLTASYGGATGFATSTSIVLTQVISKADSTVALVSSLNPSVVGDAVTFTATVTASNGVVPTGSVEFLDGSTTLATVSLNGSGVATYTTSALAAGSHSIVATYGGNGSTETGTSNTVTQVVKPATPTITPSGPTAFCAGGSVTLTSSSASGNQWYLNGSPIGGETNQQYLATAAGSYTVVVTIASVSSDPSAAVTVTINPSPDATITAPASVISGMTGNTASVADAGLGATYNWSITNGSITAGTGTNSITFTAGAIGTLTLDVTVTTALACPDTKSANVNVTTAGPVTVSSILPSAGSTLGGSAVTITGTGFANGAAVTIGGNPATDIVVVSSTQITAKTAAHTAGPVNVVVTNADTASGTLFNGYTYMLQVFDPNNDSTIDPSDIFYLVAYLFTGGPAPAGSAGMASGDANGDGVVDPSDIFFAVNYLFNGGPAPLSVKHGSAPSAKASRLSGEISLGRATRRENRWIVPVIVTMDPGSATPQAVSIRVNLGQPDATATVRGTAGAKPVFEASRGTGDSVSYIASFNQSSPLTLGNSRSVIVAEIEAGGDSMPRLTIDPAVTQLSTAEGTRSATISNGGLRISGTAVRGRAMDPSLRDAIRKD